MINRKKYLTLIQKELEDKETVLFLIGARQVGKTTLLNSLVEFGIIQAEETLFLQGDKIWNSAFSTGDELLERIQINHTKLPKYLIIDEVQYISNIGIILKNIIDDVRSGKNSITKIIVSGSGSLNTFKGITDSLIGRKRVIPVYSFDFEEFCQARECNLSLVFSNGISQPIYQTMQSLFEEYLLFGGYPKIVLKTNGEKKRELFVSLFNDYILKDVGLLLKENEILGFQKFLKAIAARIGSLVSLSNIASETGISRYILEKYMFIIENTFITHKIAGFVGGKTDGEIKTKEKVYFNDVGFLRYVLDINKRIGDLKGKIIENFVLQQVLANKKMYENIYFRNKRGGAEVDFIIKDSFASKIIPLEVKSGNFKKFSKSYQVFFHYYQEIITCGLVAQGTSMEKKAIGEKEIFICPYFLVGNQIKVV